MSNLIIAIDQSTSATKAMLFDENCNVLARHDIPHKQFYPQAGFVEHDPEEIYANTVEAIKAVSAGHKSDSLSIALTNQRETVVVWNRLTGKPIANAVVWQDTRGQHQCSVLKADGKADLVMSRSGLLIDPNFSASGVAWLLDNVPGARAAASRDELMMGTIDTWLIYKLTDGASFKTDTTNASRTMLFNIHTLDWDDDLLALFDIPRSMMPEVLPCDSIFGETTLSGFFKSPIQIAGVLGDSHGALVGQMCFTEGVGKVTYGTGSSVMVNIGDCPLPPPPGLVTSVGFSAWGKTYEGNIYSTGATLKWISDQLKLIDSPALMEAEATSVPDNGGVYIVPAFSGLGAPWWKPTAKAAIVGMSFATTRAHVIRAALESIAFQIKDLVSTMSDALNGKLTELSADGGPTRNVFLMQLQADLLGCPLILTEVEDASALGAVLMNGFARGVWSSPKDVLPLKKVKRTVSPVKRTDINALYDGWLHAVNGVCNI